MCFLNVADIMSKAASVSAYFLHVTLSNNKQSKLYVCALVHAYKTKKTLHGLDCPCAGTNKNYTPAKPKS